MDDKARIRRTTRPAVRLAAAMPPIHSGRRAASIRRAGSTSGWRRTASRSPSRAARASQPRQAYCFAMGPSLGWRGDSAGLVKHGLDYWCARFQRPDGLFRTLVNADGSVADDRAITYDQAFGLLAFNRRRDARRLARRARAAGARAAAGRVETHEARGRWLRERRADQPAAGIESAHAPVRSHARGLRGVRRRASLWKPLADEIAEFALAHFFDRKRVAARVLRRATGSSRQGVKGRIVEPGHQFEWAWLLLRWARRQTCEGARGRAQAHRRHRSATACATGSRSSRCSTTFLRTTPSARLWPQTERLKAAALAARLTGEAKYFAMAASAADALQRYLATPIPGLWYDRIDVNGNIVDEPAPASSSITWSSPSRKSARSRAWADA